MINRELRNEVIELFDSVLGIEHSLLNHLMRDLRITRMNKLKEILKNMKVILEEDFQIGLACISVKNPCGFDLYELLEFEELNESEIYCLTEQIKNRLIKLYLR